MSGSASKAESVTRVHFGSCNCADLEQPHWEHILARNPSLWIWAGDNIYGDQASGLEFKGAWPDMKFKPADEAILRRMYAMQEAVPGYAKLVKSVPVLGTWDDHDFGTNDGDRRYPFKKESQEAFLDFIGEPKDSIRRSQAGVYASKRLDFPGGGSILVILLDMRYNRDVYGTVDGDFLGEEQWSWLEKVLQESTARVNLVVSPVQMLEGRQALNENWERFPKARERMLRLLTSGNISAPIVLSGDVHFGELSAASCNGGRLLEVTSSGMTHSWGTRIPQVDHPILNGAASIMVKLAQAFMPWRYQLRDEAGAPQVFFGLHFGELEFDWVADTLKVSIVDDDDRPALQMQVSLASLDMHGDGGPPRCLPERGVPERWRTYAGFASTALVVLSPLCLFAVLCGFGCRRRQSPSKPKTHAE